MRKQQATGLLSEGDLLVAEFQQAMNTLSAVESAKYYADQSEQAALENIAAVDTGGQVYLDPQAIPAELRTPLAKASIDAHLKRVQAGQIEAFSEQQLAAMNEAARQKYMGRKLRVSAIDPRNRAIETYWYDPANGDIYPGEHSPKAIKGVIVNIDLGGNFIAVKPTFATRLLNNSLQYYLAYIIDPQTAEPLLRIAFN